jgi:hypothetical protein
LLPKGGAAPASSSRHRRDGRCRGESSAVDDPGELVEGGAGLAERRPELAEDAGDDGTLGEQGGAGVEQLLDVGAG